VKLHVTYDAPGFSVPRLAVIAGIALAALGLAVAVLISIAEGPVICPLRTVTGLPCPFCGMLRSANAVLRGHVGTAFATNPLDSLFLLVVLPAMIVTWAARVWRRVALQVELTPRERRTAWTALFLAVALNWAYVLVTQT